MPSYKPTRGMISAAKQGLALRKEQGAGDLPAPEAAAQYSIASHIASGESLSMQMLKGVRSALERIQKGGDPYVPWQMHGGDAGKQWADKIVAGVETRAKVQKAINVYGEASWERYCQGHAAPDEDTRTELLRKAQVFADNADAIFEKGLSMGMVLQKAGKLAGRMRWRGLNISIENAVGDARHWYDPHNEEKGTTYMLYAYGYIRGTEAADGEHLDVYVGPMLNEDTEEVYVIHQNKAPDFERYDEDKVMLGFTDAEAAKQAYLAHYNDPRFFRGMSVLSADDFVEKCKSGHKGKMTCKSYTLIGRLAMRSISRRMGC